MLNGTQESPNPGFSIANWIIVIIGWFYVTFEYTVRVSDSVILPQLQASFDLSSIRLSVLSSSYYITYVLSMIPAGILIDRLGLYRAWGGAILVLTLGCALFALRINFDLLIIARILMGAGSSFAAIGVFAMMLRHKYSGFLIGVTMAVAMLGAWLGEGPWAQLVHFFGAWATAYWFAAGIGLGLWLIWILYARTVSLTLVHMHMSRIGVTFIQLMRSPVFWILALFIGCLSAPQTAFMALWGPRYLATAYHLPATTAAYANSLIAIGGLIGALILGWIGDRYRNIKLILGIVAIITIFCMFAIIQVWFVNVHIVLLLLFILGLITNANVLVFAYLGKYFYSFSKTTIQGTTNMFNMGGGPIFQLIIGMVISLQTANITVQLTAPVMQKALLAIPIGLIIVTLLLLSLSPKRLVID